MIFRDRIDAGQQLCPLLKQYHGQDVVVYAIPRGGVVVAAQIAKFLHAPLDLVLAHKIGHPYSSEYAIAAVSESGHLIKTTHEQIEPQWLEGAKAREMQEIKRKRERYLAGRPAIPIKDKIALIIDDGIATGLTMQVSIQELRGRHPSKIVAVVPVSPRSTAKLLQSMADDFVAVLIPGDGEFFGSVGAYYHRFDQVEDDEVMATLAQFSSI